MQVTVKGRFVGGALYQPKDTNNGKKFSACVVLEPGEEKKIQKIAKEAITEKFGSKPPKKLKDWTVRVGDDEEFEHSFERSFINPKAKEDKRPAIMRRVAGELEPTEDVYAGCFVHVSVNAYAYAGNPKDGIDPGVALGLRGVLFWKDGDRIGGGFSESEFDGFESEDLDADAFGQEEAESLL